jgi:hypothetical protein
MSQVASHVAHHASAPLPAAGHGLEAVIEGLLALRAEIDATLAQLAAQSTLIAMAVAAGAAEAAPALPVEAASDVGLADASPGILEAEVALEGGLAANAIEALAEPAETVSLTAAAELDGPPMVLDANELAPEEPLCATPASGFPAAAAAAAVEDMAVQCVARAETADDITVATGVAAGEEVTGEAQEPARIEERPSAGAEQMEAGASFAGASLAGGATLGVAHGNATVGAATIVHLLEARQQEHKVGPITRRVRARSSRYLAAKIAAALLVLLTAAGAMMMANRTALGGVPSLAWIAPSPPSTISSGLERLWQRLRMGGAQSPKARAVPADPSLLNEVPLEVPLANPAVTSGS